MLYHHNYIYDKMIPMCSLDDCTNSMFSSGLCLRHYRYSKYGICVSEDCHSPSCGKHGLCDNCRRRGPSKAKHYGKHINTVDSKWCDRCKRILPRTSFYDDRGRSSYLCKQCHAERRPNAKLRAKVISFGMKNVIQTSAMLCVKCWNPLDKWEMDHIVPSSKGGADEVSNLQIMCVTCNRTKGNRESVDYREFIRRQNANV